MSTVQTGNKEVHTCDMHMCCCVGSSVIIQNIHCNKGSQQLFILRVRQAIA